jgi:predicted DCC family thiol-disulfide oxidoreductase YuxK
VARSSRRSSSTAGASGPPSGRVAVPLLIWDGDCGFCRRSVEHLRIRLGDRVAYEPYQTAQARFPEIPLESFRAAVHLVEPDGRATRGAEAVFRALAYGEGRPVALPLAAYRFVPGFAALAEGAYRLVASHRPFASRLVDRLVADLVGPPQFRLTRLVFLRLLALAYLAAFLSLGAQVHGLVGERGLLPARQFLDAVRMARGDLGFWLVPTLGWLGAGDIALSVLCYGGAAAAFLAFVGFAQGPLLFVCWAFYLSLVHLGQDFLSFQWDILLVETGFAALLLAPWAHLRPRRPADEPRPSTAVVWLLRLVLFKLMFSSGLTKLTWGDPTWHDLSALTYHYWTQPIPTPLAWYASRLPLAVQKLPCALMFVVELALPFLIFAPRRPRLIAFWGFLALQLLIAATGNYGFFNALAVVLCVPLLDDRAWPAAFRARLSGSDSARRTADAPERAGSLGRRFVSAVAGVVALLSISPLVESFHPGFALAGPRRVLLRASAVTSPFFLSNSYGLFRSMTTTRPEIQLETSPDGEGWREVVFRYKPGDPARAPRFFAPHMPRLDWQMWFAALSAEALAPDREAAAGWLQGEEMWLGRVVVALLRGERPVLDLLAPGQFEGGPPRYVRLVLWQYRFSDGGPDWWVRRRVAVLAGPFALSPSAAVVGAPDPGLGSGP